MGDKDAGNRVFLVRDARVGFLALTHSRSLLQLSCLLIHLLSYLLTHTFDVRRNQYRVSRLPLLVHQDGLGTQRESKDEGGRCVVWPGSLCACARDLEL